MHESFMVHGNALKLEVFELFVGCGRRLGVLRLLAFLRLLGRMLGHEVRKVFRGFLALRLQPGNNARGVASRRTRSVCRQAGECECRQERRGLRTARCWSYLALNVAASRFSISDGSNATCTSSSPCPVPAASVDRQGGTSACVSNPRRVPTARQRAGARPRTSCTGRAWERS